MLRTIFAGLRANKLRLLLSSVAIFLGVGFVAGTLVLSASMKQSFFDAYAREAQGVDAAVLANPSGSNIAPSLLTSVRAAPGVSAAVGHVTGPAPLIGANGRVVTNAGSPGVGINVPSDAQLRGFTLLSGHLPTAPNQVLIDSATVATQHFRIGQSVGVVDQASHIEHFTLVGVIDPGTSKTFSKATVVAFEPPTAMRITGLSGYQQIDARAASGTSPATLVSRLSALPGASGFQVLTGSQLAVQEANNVVHFTSLFTAALLLFAVVALLVAALVIYNTFTILVAQRLRELALLRCVGASRAQVFGATLAESAVVGVLASLLGIGVGLVLALLMIAVLGAFGTSLPATSLVVTGQTVWLSILIGSVVTIGSALVPALRATRVPPVAALGEQYEPAENGKRAGWLRIGIIVVFGVTGVALALIGSGDKDGITGLFTIVTGGCVLFIAVLAAGPLYVGPLTGFFGALPAILMGAPARLATANSRRNPFRVASTTAALTIGVTLVTLFAVVSASLNASAAAVINKHYPFDYQVSSILANKPGAQVNKASGATTAQSSVPRSITSALKASPKFRVVAANYSDSVTIDGTTEHVDAMDPSAFGTVFLPSLAAGSLAGLNSNTIALDTKTMARLGVHYGGTVTVVTPDGGTATERIAAVMNSADDIPNAVMTSGQFRTDYQPAGAASVSIIAASGVSTANSLAAVNRIIAPDPVLAVLSATEYKATLHSSITGILQFFSALVGLAILIALFGITNTLSLSVIERTRESALLRALGLTRTQLRRMLALEAVQMSMVGALIGVILGVGFGWAVMRTFIKSSGGVGAMAYPVGQILLYFVIAAAAGVLASLLPARRAARASIVGAITSG